MDVRKTYRKGPIKWFETSEEDDEEVVAAEGEQRKRARILLDEHRRKQARLVQSNKYRLTKHVYRFTCNQYSGAIVPQSKTGFDRSSQSITPKNLELL